MNTAISQEMEDIDKKHPHKRLIIEPTRCTNFSNLYLE
jgi:hypothetical protein